MDVTSEKKRKRLFPIENVFLVMSTVILGIMIFVMPLNRVPDESTHAFNSWATIYNKSKDSFTWSTSLSQKAPIERAEYKKVFTEKIDLSHERFRLGFTRKTIQYLPQALGMWLGSLIYPSVGVIITVGRLINSLFYIISLFFIIKYMKNSKIALAFIALLPISIQQAASLSYDTANFVAISFFFAIITNLVEERVISKKYIVPLFLALVGLFLTKTNNLSLILLLPFIGLLLPERFQLINRKLKQFYAFCNKRKYWLVTASAMLLLIGAIIYLRNKEGITHFSQIMINSLFNNKVNPALNSVVSAGIFGFVGLFHIQFPLWLLFFDVGVLTLLLFSGDEHQVLDTSRKPYVIAMTTIFPLQVALVFAGMYFSWTMKVLGKDANISTGSQGRYFTPFLIFFAPILMRLQNSMGGTVNRKLMERIFVITILVNFLITIYLIMCVYWYPDRQADWLLRIREMLN